MFASRKQWGAARGTSDAPGHDSKLEAHAMTADPVRLIRPNGKPFWIVYGVRRIADDRLVYVGQTQKFLWYRWCTHQAAAGRPNSKNAGNPFLKAIREYTPYAFRPEELACCTSRRDAEEVEAQLISLRATLHPDGYNSRGPSNSAEFTSRHRAAIAKALANLSPEQRARRAENAQRNGQRTRELWQGVEREERLAFLKRTVDNDESKAKVRAATQRAWTDPAKRPAKLAQLRTAIANSVANRRRHARIKDPRQDDLI
jgi:hypothetical protein